MTIPVNATLRGVAQFTIGTVSRAQNVYHFAHLSVEDKTDEQVVLAIGEYIVDLMTNLTSELASTFVLEKVECFVLAGLLWEPIGVTTPTWDGGNVNDRLPSGVAMMVTAFKARSGYADRKYIGGWTEEDIVGDFFVGSAMTAIAAYAADWIAQYVGTDTVVLLPVSFRPLDGVTRPYTSFGTTNKASYQRRRKPGVGLT